MLLYKSHAQTGFALDNGVANEFLAAAKNFRIFLPPCGVAVPAIASVALGNATVPGTGSLQEGATFSRIFVQYLD